MIDKTIFAYWIGVFSERFNVPPFTPSVAREFYGALAELDTESFQIGAASVFATSRFAPSPQEIIDAAAPDSSPELAGAELFGDLLRWVGKRDLERMKAISPSARRALDAIGGESELSTLTTAALPFARRDFVAAYSAATRVERSLARVRRARVTAGAAIKKITAGEPL